MDTDILNMLLNQTLDGLVEQWCERRALRPLKYVLPVYPGSLAHTDQLGDLLEALRDVKGLCREDLSQNELAQVISSINELEDRMHRKQE
jgi:hypothetical protein